MSSAAWQPSVVRRFVQGFPSSARTALVETDAGLGYLKAMGAPEGPHTLAAELVGTQLAQWFGLSTLQFAIIALDDIVEIPFLNNEGNRTGEGAAGPAFITRAESGDTWSGDEKQLRLVVNPQDISRLVVFDTWTLNCDRYSLPTLNLPQKPRINRNNVFLSEEAPKGQFLLKAIDHTHCFTCGRVWTPKLSEITMVKDTRLFGLFPEFWAFLDRNAVVQAVSDLGAIDRDTAAGMTRAIPREWEVAAEAADALVDLILRRAAFVAETIEQRIWPQADLGF
jgi:hypothetical protein